MSRPRIPDGATLCPTCEGDPYRPVKVCRWNYWGGSDFEDAVCPTCEGTGIDPDDQTDDEPERGRDRSDA